MKTAAVILSAAGLVAGMTTTPTLAQQPGDVIPDRYIVQLKPGVAPANVARAHGAVPVHVFNWAFNGYAGFIPPGLLARVAADPQVEDIIPDRVMSIVAKPNRGGGSTTSQVVPPGIIRVGAQPPKTGTAVYTGSGVGVAIVDTGIDLAHDDLRENLGGNHFSAFGESAKDDHGHGTHVAGTVAARHNDRHVVGIAPEATLYAVKVLNAQGSGSDSDIMAGLQWIAANAADHNIKVANLSLGRTGTLGDNTLLRQSFQAVVSAGVTVVVAAGNDCGSEVSQKVPATYPEVIAVASTTAETGSSPYTTKVYADTASYFTTDGAFDAKSGIGVSVSAPGEEREDILRGGRISSVGILSTRLGGGTTRMSGTSMAAPHVAGVAALIHQKNANGISATDVRAKLMSSADRSGQVPLGSPTSCYSADGDLEGVVYAPNALK